MTAEEEAYLTGRPIAIIGGDVDDDRQPVWAVTFVANLFDLAFAALARTPREWPA